MKKCKITVMAITQYPELMAQYENPMDHACDMAVGQVFFTNGWEKPEGFCQSAWEVLSPFVLALIRPKIYLPFSLGADTIGDVQAHQQAHITPQENES